MNNELIARRDKAGVAFDDLQQAVQRAKAELRSKGVETFEEAHEELMRLQGEFRVINDLMNKPETPPVSPDPATIDVEAAEKSKK